MSDTTHAQMNSIESLKYFLSTLWVSGFTNLNDSILSHQHTHIFDFQRVVAAPLYSTKKFCIPLIYSYNELRAPDFYI